MSNARASGNEDLPKGSDEDVFLEYFQRVTFAHSIRRRLRGMSAWAGFLSGMALALVGLLMYLGKFKPTPLGIAAVAGMSVLFLLSLVCAARPSPRLAQVMVFLAMAAFAGFALAHLLKGENRFAAIWPAVLAALMVRHLRSLARWRRDYEDFVSSPESAEALAAVDGTLRGLFKTNMSKDNRIADFTHQTFLSTTYWRGLLLNDAAIFVESGANHTAIVPRGDLDIDASKPSTFAKKRSVSISIGPKRLRVIMSNLSYQRLTAWNARLGPSHSVGAN